jgi:hypothetical protein
MSDTNLKAALERKYALFKGELGEKRQRIDYIESLFREELPKLTAREQRLHRLIDCAEEILKEINPSFSPDKVRPIKPHVHKAPTAIGQIAKVTLDILRESTASLTIRQIADEIVVREELGDITEAEHKRLRNSIDATLRDKLQKGLVTHDGAKFARKWRICTAEERRSQLKPAKTSSKSTSS